MITQALKNVAQLDSTTRTRNIQGSTTMFDERSNSDNDSDHILTVTTSTPVPLSSPSVSTFFTIPPNMEHLKHEHVEGELLDATERALQEIHQVLDDATQLTHFLNVQESDLDIRAKLAPVGFTICNGFAQIVDYNDGSKYKGELDTNRVRHGKGTYYYPSGTVYKGEWENGGRHGLGVCEFVSQNKYCGYWTQGRREGLGIFCFTKERRAMELPIPWKQKVRMLSEEDRERYEGEFLHDQRHGFGVYYFPDGSSYAGYWQHNRRHGKGTYYFTSGRTYVGDWLNSQRDGYGIMKDRNGQILYMGEWSNDRKEGKGLQQENGDWITGVWKGNKLEKNVKIDLFPFKHKLNQLLHKYARKRKYSFEDGFKDVVFLF